LAIEFANTQKFEMRPWPMFQESALDALVSVNVDENASKKEKENSRR
jgi:aromatic ring-cleaving dioxygenase